MKLHLCNKENEVAQITAIDLIKIYTLVLLLSIVVCLFLNGKVNNDIYIQDDLILLTEHLNESITKDNKTLYGKNVSDVDLIKNKDLKEYIDKGQVYNVDGIVTRSDLENNNAIILDLDPFIKDIESDLKLYSNGCYVGTSFEKGQSLTPIYIKNKNVKKNTISINDYYKLMN